jgi:hypothetical protein
MQLIYMMTKNPSPLHRRWLGLVLLLVVAWNCNGRPARKKLPDLTGDPASWEGVTTTADRHPEQIPGLPPFYASDTTLLLGGRTADLLTISLPEPAFDSLTMRIVTAWSPMARTLLDQLAARGEKGVLIDLRSASSQQDRSGASSTAYLVEKQGSAGAQLSLPVVFCWDGASAARARAFIDVLQKMPEFRYIRIDRGKGNPPVNAGCFSADPPTNFDQQ